MKLTKYLTEKKSQNEIVLRKVINSVISATQQISSIKVSRMDPEGKDIKKATDLLIKAGAILTKVERTGISAGL